MVIGKETSHIVILQERYGNIVWNVHHTVVSYTLDVCTITRTDTCTHIYIHIYDMI